ncbi:hypothetical protein O0235_01190 [Tepidiforma flava]|uniref:Uncharacterized protein n=1 Tax=Tepidiforma flava TaxID=3004094 RepID=A0ABY7M6U4_9CHLR|nr:hypothetical protein [Tepidiforma flava]WBL36247.1 hypothetical protein O0235_01190 [Tepidiforma flava]
MERGDPGEAGAGAFTRGNPHRGGGFRAPAALARVYDAGAASSAWGAWMAPGWCDR